MVKEWVESEDEIRRKGSVMEAGLAGIEAMEGAVPSGWEEIPLKELRKQPASKFVRTKQRWCQKFIAESYGHIDINKEKEKTEFKIVLNVVNQYPHGKAFDIDEIINLTGATDLSEGTLQRRILSWMVCLGILQMSHIKLKNKNGKDKIKYVFVKNPVITPCPEIISNKCGFDWKHGSVTDYFPPEYKKQLDEDSQDE